jgi:hypothetical protein
MTTVALSTLRECRRNLRAAQADAQHAATRLDGALAVRARELVDKLSDALDYVERLAFTVEGDLRAARADP